MKTRSEKLSFPNRDGELLAGRLELPAGEPRAYALFAHCFSCSKDIAAASRVSRALSKLGLGVLRFDFTGLGASEGDFGNAGFTSNVDDLVAAADHLREQHGRAPELLIGHSLGGAAVLAAAPRIPESKAVATIGAPSEPEHVRHLFRDQAEEIEREGSAEVELGTQRFRIGKAFLDDIARQDLSKILPELRRALMILHSPTDSIVGIDHARRLFEWARHPKSFVSLDTADHLLSKREDSAYVAEVLAAWSARHVGVARTAVGQAGARSGSDPGEVMVEELGPPYAQRIRVGRHELVGDEPKSVGGKDLGPDPYAFLLASLGECTAVTLRMYAERKGWPLERVALRLAHEKIHAEDCATCETEKGRVDRISKEIRLDGPLDEAQRARLLEIAGMCPVHRTLNAEVRIESRLFAAGTDPAETS